MIKISFVYVKETLWSSASPTTEPIANVSSRHLSTSSGPVTAHGPLSPGAASTRQRRNLSVDPPLHIDQNQVGLNIVDAESINRINEVILCNAKKQWILLLCAPIEQGRGVKVLSKCRKE